MKLSVVLPAKDDSCFRKSVESILMQKEHDYELLILCDEAQENDMAYENYLVQEYPHIRILTSKQRESYCLENSGIYSALGDYILFMKPGDEFISNNAFSLLMEEMRDLPDILMFPYDTASENAVVSEHQTVGNAFLQMLHQGIFDPDVSLYCYKRSLLYKYQLNFYSGIQLKDIYFTLQVCAYLHTYALITKPLYRCPRKRLRKENWLTDILLLLDIFETEQKYMEHDMGQFVLEYLAHLYIYVVLFYDRQKKQEVLWRQIANHQTILHYHENPVIRKLGFFYKFYGYGGMVCVLKIYNKIIGGHYGECCNLYY